MKSGKYCAHRDSNVSEIDGPVQHVFRLSKMIPQSRDNLLMKTLTGDQPKALSPKRVGQQGHSRLRGPNSAFFIDFA
jgi:hypothetical protein